MKHIHLDSVDSTMNYLARPEIAACEDSFILVTTEEQTQGRGQQGTHWESQRGKNLLFSLLIRHMPLQASESFVFARLHALVLIETLDEYAQGFSIKWPNDIYYDNHKICGTLTQHTLQGNHLLQTIVGVGLNVNQSHFESDAPNPISLCRILGHEVNLDTLLARYISRLKEALKQLTQTDKAQLQQRYTERLYRREEWHYFRTDEQRFEGKIVGVDSAGCLILALRDGSQQHFAFKSIQYE